MTFPVPSRFGPLAVLLVGVAVTTARADGPQDNRPATVRPIPPAGIDVPEATLAELRAGLADLRKDIDALPGALAGKPELLDLIPDVEVFHKAVRYAVEHGEFYTPKEPDAARQLLEQGRQRARELRDGNPTWPTATGLVVRGYRSKIDDSVQPYGLVIPKTYDPAGTRKHRLDVWWRGREEKSTEVNFMTTREKSPGEFTPPDALVLHPFGRYCNANKFAGEVDTFECLAHVKKHYRIDENRIVARGFSMGGAACWQFAVHYPTLWAAAAPGAGFAETPEFLNNFQNERVKPTWWEERLWRWYNATDYAVNIFNVPTVAYSGENDRQKQAADVMARELAKEGIELVHVIGPKTGHKYEPGAKKEINERIDAVVSRGRPDVPSPLLFQTYTLRYNRCGWVEVLGLERHWEKAVVIAEVVRPGTVQIKTANVTALRVNFTPGQFPFETTNFKFEVGPKHLIEGKPIPPVPSDKSFSFTMGEYPPDGLAKRHGLQGPIDDAFMDRFLMVAPTGKPISDKVGAWTQSEMRRAAEQWKRQFRGDAPMKDDTAVSDDDIKSANLILWGDPQSNQLLRKIADKLPVKWETKRVIEGDQQWDAWAMSFGGENYDPFTQVPVLIFPNPLNPEKYVVLNSGFTFREYDYLNNARQVPKLPDYAIVDVTTPPNSRWPGKVVRAGFFGENWEVLPEDGK